MTLKAGLLDLIERMSLRDRGVAFGALDFAGHDIRLRLLLIECLSPDEHQLRLMAMGAVRLGLVVTAEAFHSRLVDLSVLLPGNMTDIAVEQSRDVLLMGEGDPVDHNLRIFKSSMAFTAL